MGVEYVILAVSIINLIMFVANLYLLRRGFNGLRQIQVVVVNSTGAEVPVTGGAVSAHRVVTLGRHGDVTYFNGEGEAVTLFRLDELQNMAGDIADVYVVPRRAK